MFDYIFLAGKRIFRKRQNHNNQRDLKTNVLKTLFYHIKKSGRCYYQLKGEAKQHKFIKSKEMLR
jgi:hypothetical protein